MNQGVEFCALYSHTGDSAVFVQSSPHGPLLTLGAVYKQFKGAPD